MTNLTEVFQHTLEDVYYAENAILQSLPKVISFASNAELKKGLREHHAETEGQVEILKQVFKAIGQKPAGEKCDAIEGLIKETDGLIEELDKGSAADAAIIGCCQAIEHYEIARYGTLREWAKALGETEAHDLLTQILDQEKAANSKLTNMAVGSINGGGRAPRKAAAKPKKMART
ncbi:MAG: ferritin-like domain-containing protein [Hyphomicrobium sp.]